MIAVCVSVCDWLAENCVFIPMSCCCDVFLALVAVPSACFSFFLFKKQKTVSDIALPCAL